MRCRGCGRENPPDALFCQLCGTPSPIASGHASASPANRSPRYAGFGSRLAAHMIDSSLMAAVLFIPMAVGFVFLTKQVNLQQGPPSSQQLQSLAGLVKLAGPLVAFGVTAVYWLYHGLMTSSRRRATLGKLALGLEVTDMQGGRISFGRASLRFFGTLVSGSMLNVGYLIQPFTEKKQALHDLMAGTLVIKT